MAFRVVVRGVVQGVGFRPFIYRIAKGKNLRGYVRNAGNSVELLLQGEREEVNEFVETVKRNHPPLSEIFSIDVKSVADNEVYEDFLILKSEAKGETGSAIPPDVALCDKCIQEIFDPGDKRYRYPFTVCTDCGPRFTIIEDLPYDREKTTMRVFPMCRDCSREYEDPLDRRFHAEPTCCPVCGPEYILYKGRDRVNTSDPVRDAAKAIDRGRIVAIKGVGGTHLATKTTMDEPILRIREMLGRPQKPFAVMARDIGSVEDIAFLGAEERNLIESFRRPIVLLKKRDGALSEYISPGLHNIGVMLPYAGVHHLLFHHSREPAFVMTSANIPGEPMAIEDKDIFSLGSEYSLIHNRGIANRCDDSVVKIVAGEKTLLRRSRGYVPQLIDLNIEDRAKVLALGPELDVTACLLKGNKALVSQYIGNTTKIKTLEYLGTAVENLMSLSRVEEIDAVAVDLHPGFSTARLGEELGERYGAKVVRVQHHHAHIASLMMEHSVKECVGIAVDGVGYGIDGKPWGGEIMVATLKGFERVGSLMPQPMPGGDLATRFPARMVAGILSSKYPLKELGSILRDIKGFRNSREVELILRQLDRGFNTPETTSAGRVLDAISALLGVCYERTYEGEPAVKLESFAQGGKALVDIPVAISENKRRMVLDTASILEASLFAIGRYKKRDIAASAQKALATGLARMALMAAEKNGIRVVGISGGVAYNDAIVTTVKTVVEAEGLRFISHRRVPCGDGGVSLGQAAVAAM